MAHMMTLSSRGGNINPEARDPVVFIVVVFFLANENKDGDRIATIATKRTACLFSFILQMTLFLLLEC